MTDLVSRTDRQAWTLLTLNRPDKLNALTVEMFRELRRHVAEPRDDDSVGCVVLRRAGRCFSAERFDAGIEALGPDTHERIAAFTGRSQRGETR